MNIEQVRVLAKRRARIDFNSQSEYARHLGVTPNNLSLFLNAKGNYKDTVPALILDDLGLKPLTTTKYVKKESK